jgi:hypothetical protein
MLFILRILRKFLIGILFASWQHFGRAFSAAAELALRLRQE